MYILPVLSYGSIPQISKYSLDNEMINLQNVSCESRAPVQTLQVKEENSTLEAKEASESTWKMLAKNSNLMTGAIAKEKAKAIPMEDREYHTLESFVAGAYSFGGRFTGTLSNYTSFNTKTQKVEEYILVNGSIGFASPDISIAIGKGIYWKDSREEIEKLTKSAGGSITLLGVSLGIDFLSEPIESKGMLEDFSNIKGFRIYIGKGFIPLGTELHTSFLDYGTPIYETKYKSYHEYFKTKTLPTAIREYYNNYYNRGERNR